MFAHYKFSPCLNKIHCILYVSHHLLSDSCFLAISTLFLIELHIMSMTTYKHSLSSYIVYIRNKLHKKKDDDVEERKSDGAGKVNVELLVNSNVTYLEAIERSRVSFLFISLNKKKWNRYQSNCITSRKRRKKMKCLRNSILFLLNLNIHIQLLITKHYLYTNIELL